MKLFISDLLEHWYRLIEYAKKNILSSQWRKISAAPRTKDWSDILLIIRLLFIVPVSYDKLQRMFSKLKCVKISFSCSRLKVSPLLVF